jgi:hypothetical protein
MGPNSSAVAERLHRVNGEKRPRMAKAVLPKGENGFRAEWRVLGECLDEARHVLRWTVDRLSKELERDEKQVARWMRGEERTQVDRVYTVPSLWGVFVIALARRSPDCVVETVVRLRRQA